MFFGAYLPSFNLLTFVSILKAFHSQCSSKVSQMRLKLTQLLSKASLTFIVKFTQQSFLECFLSLY